MLQRLYFRYGLRWAHRYVPLTSALMVGIIVGGIIGWGQVLSWYIDDEKRMLLHQKEEAVKTLLECMNGQAVWRHPNGKQTGFAFGFRVHRCLGTEEFDI